jgi:hypothetical protein
MRGVRIVLFLHAVILSVAVSGGPALAQRDRDGGKVPVKAGQDPRGRSDAQRGNGRDMRQERMRPEEREKLRRDIEDANRNIQRKR